MGHERPFTGEHWWTQDVGIYSCVVCTQRLFMSDHKYDSKSGFPTFWNHIIDSVDFKNDHLPRPVYTNAHEDPVLKNKQPIHRCICSNCESHIGAVYNDGPPPLYKRFQISDSALSFELKPWFKKPEFSREEIQELKIQRNARREGTKKFRNLLNDEKYIGIPPYIERMKLEKEEKQA